LERARAALIVAGAGIRASSSERARALNADLESVAASAALAAVGVRALEVHALGSAQDVGGTTRARLRNGIDCAIFASVGGTGVRAGLRRRTSEKYQQKTCVAVVLM
jgi:hypothetical protein